MSLNFYRQIPKKNILTYRRKMRSNEGWQYEGGNKIGNRSYCPDIRNKWIEKHQEYISVLIQDTTDLSNELYKCESTGTIYRIMNLKFYDKNIVKVTMFLKFVDFNQTRDMPNHSKNKNSECSKVLIRNLIDLRKFDSPKR